MKIEVVGSRYLLKILDNVYEQKCGEVVDRGDNIPYPTHQPGDHVLYTTGLRVPGGFVVVEHRDIFAVVSKQVGYWSWNTRICPACEKGNLQVYDVEGAPPGTYPGNYVCDNDECDAVLQDPEKVRRARE